MVKANTLQKLADLVLFDGEIPTKNGEEYYARDYILKPQIPPYLVYNTLKETFGPPNGNQFDDDKTQWQWLFTYDDMYVEIYDWKVLSTSIAIYHQKSDLERCKQLAQSIDALIYDEARNKSDKVKALIKSSKHKILENPFVTYYSTAENLLDAAKVLDELAKNGSPTYDFALDNGDHTVQTRIGIWDKKYDIYRSAFLMFLSAFEGFLNILFELYLKPELRPSRLSDRISREQIDIKLRLAPVYCDGFKTKTINHEDNRFRDYLRLVNLRNDYVHANLTKSLETYVVFEDDYSFIIENEDENEIPTNINELRLEHVEFAKGCVDNIVELVFESMEPKTRREFKSIIFDESIEVEDEDGILIPHY